jgi:hypothetical protein
VLRQGVMDIFTVRDNLKNTILGKEMLLDYVLPSKKLEHIVVRDFLKLNLDELKTILADVETCCENLNKE